MCNCLARLINSVTCLVLRVVRFDDITWHIIWASVSSWQPLLCTPLVVAYHLAAASPPRLHIHTCNRHAWLDVILPWCSTSCLGVVHFANITGTWYPRLLAAHSAIWHPHLLSLATIASYERPTWERWRAGIIRCTTWG